MGFNDLTPIFGLDTSLGLPVDEMFRQVAVNFQDVYPSVGNEVTSTLAGYIKADGTTAFSGDQSMGGNQLTNVGAPAAGGDAANKTYVDGAITTAGGDYLEKDGSVAMTGDLDLGGNDLTNVLTATGTGDLDFGGGYRQSLDGWYRDNVGAATAATQMTRFSNGADVDEAYFARAGSITGVWVHTNDPRTAGSLTVEVYKNGVATGLQAVIDGTNTTFKATTQAKDTDAFVAGDSLDIRFSTDAGWTPIAADIRAGLEVET